MVSRCNARWEISPRRRYESTRRRSDSWAASSFMAVRVPGPCPGRGEAHRVRGSISILPSRFYVGGDRVCYFVPPKTFIRDKTPPQIHLVRSKTFIRNQIMWTTSVWPWKRCKNRPDFTPFVWIWKNGVNNRPFCHRFFNMEKTV